MHQVLRARPTEHIVTFYHSDDVVVEQVASFISEGSPRTSTSSPLPRLATGTRSLGGWRRAGLQTAVRPASDSWSSSTADEALDAVTVDGEVTVDRFRAMLAPLLNPATRTRIYGELVSLLAQRGDIEGAIALERLGHELAHAQNIRVLCGYHVDGARPLTAAEISSIQETQPQRVMSRAYAEPEGRSITLLVRSS